MTVMGRPPWLPETVTRAFCGVCGQKPPCTQHYLDHGVEAVECVIVPADDWRGAVSDVARARGLAEALAKCPDDHTVEGVREVGAEIAALLARAEGQ